MFFESDIELGRADRTRRVVVGVNDKDRSRLVGYLNGSRSEPLGGLAAYPSHGSLGILKRAFP